MASNMENAYNARKHWSLHLEVEQVQHLPVTVMMDGLMVKIHNSNGIEMCSMEQLLTMQRMLQLEIDRRMYS